MWGVGAGLALRQWRPRGALAVLRQLAAAELDERLARLEVATPHLFKDRRGGWGGGANVLSVRVLRFKCHNLVRAS